MAPCDEYCTSLAVAELESIVILRRRPSGPTRRCSALAYRDSIRVLNAAAIRIAHPGSDSFGARRSGPTVSGMGTRSDIGRVRESLDPRQRTLSNGGRKHVANIPGTTLSAECERGCRSRWRPNLCPVRHRLMA